MLTIYLGAGVGVLCLILAMVIYKLGRNKEKAYQTEIAVKAIQKANKDVQEITASVATLDRQSLINELCDPDTK